MSLSCHLWCCSLVCCVRGHKHFVVSDVVSNWLCQDSDTIGCVRSHRHLAVSGVINNWLCLVS